MENPERRLEASPEAAKAPSLLSGAPDRSALSSTAEPGSAFSGNQEALAIGGSGEGVCHTPAST